ncbi:hypothetical protein JTE90_004481 [Oedothorax gibbosus]|uniref:Uncharacterized protein n=1 Tax=Oedothorax gibbosus TaxID=931172 RepID=A0AAV6U215_9ARAC|nr:hypothetical protein JTE90_004481 [Oedothorax gibbosus]
MASTASDTEQGHVLSMDKAAFILIRIKKVFQKKKKGHLSEKPSIKKRIPLLRAKTLPAIISPSLGIIQAPLADSKSKIPTITTTTDSNGHSKISPGKSRCKRSPGSSSAGKKRDSGSESLGYNKGCQADKT